MRYFNGDAVTTKESGKTDISLETIELEALEQYYLDEEARTTRELKALESRITERVNALEALEARLTERLSALDDLEARLKQELETLGPVSTRAKR